jgi:thiol-disulfide isomerase/thioredoxin
VVRVPQDAVLEELDGTLALRKDLKEEPLGAFDFGKEGISFSLGEQLVELRRTPDLLKLHGGQELLSYNPTYAFKSRFFAPEESALEALKKVDKAARLRVFFGSWCGSCSRNLPKILRVQKDLQSEHIEFEYYGLPRPFRGEPEASKFDIHAVPTGIVFLGEKEIGRIRGADWGHPAVRLLEILQAKG